MYSNELSSFLHDVVVGLSQDQKTIPSKYFYDRIGSEIFQEISKLEEYYLPNCELEILQRQSANIAGSLEGDEIDVVELGCGDGSKTLVLLAGLLKAGKKLAYYPLDICPEILGVNQSNIRRELPDLVTEPIAGDFFASLEFLRGLPRKKLVLFLGSNLGNYTDLEAQKLFSQLNARLNSGDKLLLGLDLVKDPEMIRRAYDDRHGVTRRFNLNLLRRINRELGANFNLDGFEHLAVYDQDRKAALSFLVCTKGQEVSLPSGELFAFKPQERIHTEISRKYTLDDIYVLSKATGFKAPVHFVDSREYYTVSMLSK
jgi:L-histidine N-alpha-methyltransferase